MNVRGIELLAGAGLGAGLTYLFDAQRGGDRRTQVRDQAAELWRDARHGAESLGDRAGGWLRDAREGAESLAHDVRHRAAGVVDEVRSRVGDGNLSGVVGETGLFAESWPPSTRLVVGLAGCGLLGYGLTMDAPWACVVGSIGLGLMAEGLLNRGVSDLVPDRDALPAMSDLGMGRAY